VEWVRNALLPFAAVLPPVEVVASRVRPAKNPAPPPNIELPLTLACDPDLRDSLLKNESYLTDERVQRHAFRLDSWRNDGGAPPPAEILVLAAPRSVTHPGLSSEQWRGLSRRIRLLIVFGTSQQSLFPIPKGFRSDVAVAAFPSHEPGDTVSLLTNFLRELVHDFPLHEALRLTREWETRLDSSGSDPTSEKAARHWWDSAHLYATPEINESLRFSSHVPQVSASVDSVLPATYLPAQGEFLSRVGKRISDTDRDALGAVFQQLSAPAKGLREGLLQPLSFDRESRGMVPLAYIRHAAADLTAAVQRVSPTLQRLVSDERVRSALDAEQARGVNAKLFESTEQAASVPVDRHQPLQSGRHYLLRVNIGPHDEDSLVATDTPAIDPLLPPLGDDESHELTITLFPKDFEVGSAHSQTVRLPRFGGTIPVEWDLVAPLIDREGGNKTETVRDTTNGLGRIRGSRAECRFAFYFRNQLLQSFLLIADVEDIGSKQCVTVTCDYSQTRRFGDLNSIQPRLLSLALNEDQDQSGTHTLMLADGSRSAAVQWTETQLAGYTRVVRDALYDALTEDGKSRFRFDPQTFALDTGSVAGNFDSVVRTLADQGGRLYDQLFDQGMETALAPLLNTLSAGSDLPVQIVLHNPNYAFPWAVVYDYTRPKTPEQMAAPVCRGIGADGQACKCGTAPQGYCIRGFWGFRLILEQRTDAKPTPADSRVGQTAGIPELGLVKAVSDSYVDAFAGALPTITSIRTKPYPDTVGLLDSFRVGRPELIVFVGHQRQTGTEPLIEHELLSSQTLPVLSLSDFRTEDRRHEKWQIPRSLILLLACNSGAARVDTGASLAASFLKLGAIGVVATECSVHTPLVARFARDLIVRLAVTGTPIGEAMHATTLALVKEGCPVGLAFNYLGRAEAHLS
jgi:hypothetical protein